MGIVVLFEIEWIIWVFLGIGLHLGMFWGFFLAVGQLFCHNWSTVGCILPIDRCLNQSTDWAKNSLSVDRFLAIG